MGSMAADNSTEAPTDRTAPAAASSVAELSVGDGGIIERVGGVRQVRRRLMEMGLVPGTLVSLHNVAPLGDPLELAVRGSRLSIRRDDAALIALRPDTTRRQLKVLR